MLSFEILSVLLVQDMQRQIFIAQSNQPTSPNNGIVNSIPALVPLLAAAVTALITFLIARYTTNQKLHESIFTERKTACPKLYKILSDFLKKIEFGIFPGDDFAKPPLSKSDFICYMRLIEAWDSENAFMLTEAAVNRLYAYRRWVYYHFLDESFLGMTEQNFQHNLRRKINVNQPFRDEIKVIIALWIRQKRKTSPSTQQKRIRLVLILAVWCSSESGLRLLLKNSLLLDRLGRCLSFQQRAFKLWQYLSTPTLLDVLREKTRALETIIRSEVLTREKPASYRKRLHILSPVTLTRFRRMLRREVRRIAYDLLKC